MNDNDTGYAWWQFAASAAILGVIILGWRSGSCDTLYRKYIRTGSKEEEQTLRSKARERACSWAR